MDETPRDLVEFFTDSCDTLQLGEFIREGLDVNEPLSLEDGRRPLHVAATSGNVDMVEALLERGVDVDVPDYHGNTALHSAAREGHMIVVRQLLHREADPNLKNDKGCSILQNAVCFEHLEITRRLISNGANLKTATSADSLPPKLQTVGWQGKKSLLGLAFELGNLPIIQELMLAGADVVAESHVLMYITIREKNLQFANLLLENGADIRRQCIDRKMPLEKAITNGWYHLVEIFLDLHPSMTAASSLVEALSAGYLDIAELLIERGAELSEETKNAALSKVLTRSKHTEVAEWLFSTGPEVTLSQEEYVRYLVRAIENGNIGMVHLIIDKVDDIDATTDDRCRETPLIAATKKEQPVLPVIELLLQKGASATVCNAYGHTAMYYAAQNLDVLNVFVHWGVSVNDLVDTRLNKTALHKVLQYCSSLPVDLVEYLVNNGADLNAKDEDGQTPFHLIMRCPLKIDLFRFLINKGADLYQANNFGYMPINIAIKWKDWHFGKSSKINFERSFVEEYFEIVEEPSERVVSFICDLLKKEQIFLVKFVLQKVIKFYYEEIVLSCNTNTIVPSEMKEYEVSGINLLHVAAFKGDVKLSTTALQNGVDIDALTNEGFTALQIALYKGNPELAQHLVNLSAKLNIEDRFDLLPFHVALLSGYDDTLITQLYFETCFSIYPTVVFGVPILHLAAYTGCVSLVELLLSKGLNINTKDQNCNRILHIAVKIQSCELVNFLLKSDIDKNAQDKSGNTALHIASRQTCLSETEMSLEIPESLLRHHVDINIKNSSNETALHSAAHTPLASLLLAKKDPEVNTRSVNGSSALHYLASFLERKQETSFDPTAQVVLFLQHGADVTQKDWDEKSILAMLLENKLIDIKRIEECCKFNFASVMTYAEISEVFRMIILRGGEFCQKRQLDLLEVLFRQGFTVKDTKSYGSELLQHFMTRENTEVFKFVLENDNQLNLNDLLFTAIVRYENIQLVKLLLDRMNVNDGDSFDDSTFFHDVGLYPSPMKHGFAQMYLDRVKVKPSENFARLVEVAKFGHLSMTKTLLNKGANINSVDAQANTALHYAAASSKQKIFNLLLSRGANVELFNLKNESPIHFAARAGQLDVFKSLLANGASLLTKDLDGNTLLHKTMSFEIAHILLNQGVQVNARNSAGRTALHCLADPKIDNQRPNESTEAPDTAALLIYAGVVVNERDQGGLTALHLAAKNDHTSTATVLVVNGAQVDLQDKCGRTALHYAVEYSRTAIIDYLLKEGALAHLQNKYGSSPLSMTKYKQEVKEVFNKHLLKEKLAGLPSEELFGVHLSEEEISSCSEELERLKLTYIQGNFSLFEIFSSFLKPAYLFDEHIVEAIERFFASEWSSQFPNYRGILKSAVKRSRRTRCYLAHQALRTVHSLNIRDKFFRSLPTVVWTQVFTYLSDKDLDNIVVIGTSNSSV